MDQNNVDFQNGLGYNQTNVINERIVDNYLSRPVIVKMDEQRPIQSRCKHKKLIPEPDDTIGTAVYHGCANPKCGVGFYIQPTK